MRNTTTRRSVCASKSMRRSTPAIAADLRSKMDNLAQVSQGAFTRMYQEAAEQGPMGGAAGEDSVDDDDVVDAEIIDEGDEA